MEVSVFTAVCVMAAGYLRNKDARLYEVPGIVPLMALLAYIGFQLFPLPPEIIRVLSPGELCPVPGDGMGRATGPVGLTYDQ